MVDLIKAFFVLMASDWKELAFAFLWIAFWLCVIMWLAA